MSTLDSKMINRNRERSANLFALTGATLIPVMALFADLVPLVLATLAGCALVAWVVARVARVLRWRQEDREDALVAAAWRAAHPRPGRRLAQGRGGVMLDVTGWVLAVWIKWTLALAVGVGVAWLALPAGSGWLWTIVIFAGVVEWFVTRQLARKWGTRRTSPGGGPDEPPQPARAQDATRADTRPARPLRPRPGSCRVRV